MQDRAPGQALSTSFSRLFPSSLTSQFREEETGTSTLFFIKYFAHSTLILWAINEFAILLVGHKFSLNPFIEIAQSPTTPQLPFPSKIIVQNPPVFRTTSALSLLYHIINKLGHT